VAPAGAADAGCHLVANQLAAAGGEDRRTIDQARPLLLAAARGELSDAPTLWRHAAQDRAVALAKRISGGAERSRFL